MKKNNIMKKDIDLLKVYHAKSEPSKYQNLIKVALFPVLVIVISAIAFTFFTLDNHRISGNIKETQSKIDKISEKVNTSAGYSISLTKLIEQNTEYNTLYDNLKSYPIITKAIIDQAYIALPQGTTLSAMSYDNDTQKMTISVSSANSLNLEKYVANLKATGMYADVEYTGYQLVERQVSAAKGDKEATTSQIYETTISCSLK